MMLTMPKDFFGSVKLQNREKVFATIMTTHLNQSVFLAPYLSR